MTAPTHPKTIQDVMEHFGFDDHAAMALSRSEFSSFDNWKNWKLTTVCGKECWEIIEAALPLLKAADPAAHPLIWRGIVSAMSIVCVG